MVTGIIYSLNEGLVDGVKALSATLQSRGLNVTCVALEELRFVMFDCQADSISSVETIYFLTNDTAVEALTRIFVKRNKAVVNAQHFLCRFSKLTVQYLLFENDLPIPKNYFSPASPSIEMPADQLAFPIIVKSHRHMDRHVVLTNQADYEAVRESCKAPTPCYFEEYLDGGHVTFKSYVIETDVYYDATGQTYNSAALQRQLKNIGRIFSLEAYSVDCIVSCSTGQIYFIDVNPAPAFMGSVKARLKLAEYIRNMHGRSNGG